MSEFDQAAEQGFNTLIKFTEALIRTMNDIALRMGEYVKFSQSEAMKVNDNHMGSIVAHFGDSNVSPTIYPQVLYEQYQAGSSLSEIAESQINALIKAHEHMPDFSLEDITGAKAHEHLYYQLINKEQNKDIEEKCPCKIVAGDLLAVPRWNINDTEDGRMSFMITTPMMQQLHMTKEEIHETCDTNLAETKFTVKGMSEALEEILRDQGAPEEYIEAMTESVLMEEEQMYVITNEAKVDGSVALMSEATMDLVRERIGEDYYLLPSSRHELLAVRASSVLSPEQLREMVVSVNREELSKADYLSDNVYRYDSLKHEIKPCFDSLGKMIEYNDKEEQISNSMSIGRTR